MDFKLLIAVCLMICIYPSCSYRDKHDYFEDDDKYDDYYDSNEEFDYSKEPDNDDKFRVNDKHLKITIPNTNKKQEDEQTETSEPKYEVTEIIDDIPNNATVIGPVIANFTINIPLNNASITNATNIDINNENNEGASAKRNYISIFHIKAEYDNNKPEITVIQNNRPNFTAFQGFRNYIQGVRQGIVNGLQSFINNYNKAPEAPNIVNAPVIFLNKLQNKKSAFTGRNDETPFNSEFGVGK